MSDEQEPYTAEGQEASVPSFKLKRGRRGRVTLTTGAATVDLGPFDQAAAVMADWLAAEDFGDR